MLYLILRWDGRNDTDIKNVGVLIECDPSIKAIIVKINQEMSNAYIIEDLDDGHLVIKENMVNDLKYRLDDVRSFLCKAYMLETDI